MGTIVTNFKNAVGVTKEPTQRSYDGVLITNKTNVSGLFLDASISEGHTVEVEYTKNPVEFGASIRDHRIIQPLQFVLQGVVSDYTLDKPLTDYKEGSSLTRSQGAWEKFSELQTTGDLFDVTTILKQYSNMQIKTLSCVQAKDSSTSILFTAVLEEVIIVSTDTTTVSDNDLESGDVQEQTSSTKNKGQQQMTTPSSSFLDAFDTAAKKALGN